MTKSRSIVRWPFAHWRVVLLATLVAIGMHGLWDVAEARWLRAALQAWRASQPAVELPSIGSENDAMPSYLAASQVLPPSDSLVPVLEAIRRDRLSGTVLPGTISAAETVVAKYSEAIRLINVGNALQFDGFATPSAVRLTTFDAESARRLQLVRAFLAVESGKADEAVDAITAALIVDRRARYPMNVFTLGAWLRSWQDEALQELAFALNRLHPSDAALSRIALALEGADEDREFYRLLATGADQDIVNYLETLGSDYGSLGSFGVISTRGRFLRQVFSPLIARDLRTTLAERSAELSAFDRSWPDRVDALDAAVQPTSTIRRNLQEGFWPLGAMFANAYPPGGGWPSDNGRWSSLQVRCWIVTLAMTRTARVAIAVERYRLAHRSLPPRLAVVVPEYLDRLPVDPYSGLELKLKSEPNGFVVYSVGRNRKDEGGAETARPIISPDARWGRATRESGDIGIRIGR